MKLTFFVDDKLGGVSSLNFNLVNNCPDDLIEQEVIHIRQHRTLQPRAHLNYPGAKNKFFEFSPDDNYYHTLRRLSKAVDRTQSGVLVLNYDTEMAMLDHYRAKQTTYQLVHDDYNIGLANKYNGITDVFICHNSVVYQKLLTLFPHRKENIFYLPHGVPIPLVYRNNRETWEKPIKLLFIGRMVSTKGIFDLPEINNLLRKYNVPFEWTCIGNGPELDRLKQVWSPLDKVKFLSPSTNDEVISLSAQQDVFVLPTKFEGSPVSLLEAMSVGLVPVVSKIPGGITDTINSENGFMVDVNDIHGFAMAIVRLYNDPKLMDRLGHNARLKIVDEYDIKKTSKAYFDLFKRHKEFYHDKKIKKIPVGARLDHPLIPSVITKFVRTLIRKNGQ